MSGKTSAPPSLAFPHLCLTRPLLPGPSSLQNPHLHLIPHPAYPVTRSLHHSRVICKKKEGFNSQLGPGGPSEVGALHVSANPNLRLTPPSAPSSSHLPRSLPLCFSFPTKERRENMGPHFLGWLLGLESTSVKSSMMRNRDTRSHNAPSCRGMANDLCRKNCFKAFSCLFTFLLRNGKKINKRKSCHAWACKVGMYRNWRQ